MHLTAFSTPGWTQRRTSNGKSVRTRPALINYSVGRATYEKSPNSQDLEIIEKISALPLPADLPIYPVSHRRHVPRIANCSEGVQTTFITYFSQELHIRLRHFGRNREIFRMSSLTLVLRFWVDSHILNLSIQNRYRPEVSFSV